MLCACLSPVLLPPDPAWLCRMFAEQCGYKMRGWEPGPLCHCTSREGAGAERDRWGGGSILAKGKKLG